MINNKEMKRLEELLKKAGIKADLSSVSTRVKLNQEVIKNIEERLGREEKCIVFVSSRGKIAVWSLDGYNNRTKQLLSVRINPKVKVLV